MFDINDPSVYDDNYTILSKIRKILRALKDLISRVTNLENRPDYSLPTATSDRLGGVKIGNNLSIEEDGTLNATGGESYTLPTATSSRLGGVKIGQNLTVEEDGTLNATGGGGGGYTLPTASASTLGGVKVGQNLSIDENGVLNATGGGGSSLTGELVLGEKTLAVDSANPSSEDLLIGSNFIINNHHIPFLDVYKLDCRDVMTQSLAFKKDSDQSYVMISVPNEVIFSSIKGLIRLYRIDAAGGGSAITNAEKATAIYVITDEMEWGTGSDAYRATGTFNINFVWDYATGALQTFQINGEVTKITHIADGTTYSPQSGNYEQYRFTFFPGMYYSKILLSGYSYYVI